MRVDGTDDAQPSRCAALGRVEPELVGLPGKVLTRDATRRLQYDVHAADWLHSMCSMNSSVDVSVLVFGLGVTLSNAVCMSRCVGIWTRRQALDLSNAVCMLTDNGGDYRKADWQGFTNSIENALTDTTDLTDVHKSNKIP